jgi:hypothetical protein
MKSELDRVGRWFTRRQMVQRRVQHVEALRRAGKFGLADSYERMKLEQYAAYTGKVIVERLARRA